MVNRPPNPRNFMENITQFDLNRAIRHWRENLTRTPAIRSENLDELETHLRDSVASLQSRSLSTEEAFIVASRRIGRLDSLEAEFGKVNGGTVWLDRVLWMLIGLQIWGLVSGVVGTISSGTVWLGLVGGSFDFAAHGRMLPVLLFALMRLLAIACSLALCWWLIIRKGQSFVSYIERFFDGWVRLGVLCGALFVVSLASSALGHGSTMLFSKFADLRTFGEVITSQTYSNLFGWTIQAGGLILLTLILARKRLRINKA